MKKLLTILAAITATAFASPSMAQEALADVTQTEAYAELADGSFYFKAEYGDWRLRCTKISGETDPCQMFQLIKDSTGGAVAQVLINEITSSETFAVAGATIIVPLETALTEDFLMQIDDHPPKAYPYAYCSSVGCFVRLGFTPVDLNWLKSGQIAKLATVPYRNPETRRVLPMSLNGFTAAYDALLDANMEN